MKPADELAAFRKGWRAACVAVAERIRRDIALGSRLGDYANDLAGNIETTACPKTLTVLDSEGKRLT